MKLLIGADPEFFVRDPTTSTIVSAYGLIEGTKQAPLPVNKGAAQVDGMALEFNIHPADNPFDFNNNIQTVIGEMHRLVPNHEFVFESVADFSAEYMKDQTEEAKKLGCEPDFDAYTLKPMERPTGDEVNFRTASGHIHLGWTENEDPTNPEHIEACSMMVKQLDQILGVASVVWDPNPRRRELYGKAGAFRPKPYGVEYRVMSNAWVNDEGLRILVFEAAKYAFDRLMAGENWYEKFGSDRLIDIINSSNHRQAYLYATDMLHPLGYSSVMNSLYKKNKTDKDKIIDDGLSLTTAQLYPDKEHLQKAIDFLAKQNKKPWAMKNDFMLAKQMAQAPVQPPPKPAVPVNQWFAEQMDLEAALFEQENNPLEDNF